MVVPISVSFLIGTAQEYHNQAGSHELDLTDLPFQLIVAERSGPANCQ